MPQSTFVFVNGDPIDVGSHGDDDLLYHDGDPVPNTGASSLVFEAGTGLGGDGGITIPQLVTLPALSCALDASGDATITALDGVDIGPGATASATLPDGSTVSRQAAETWDPHVVADQTLALRQAEFDPHCTADRTLDLERRETWSDDPPGTLDLERRETWSDDPPGDSLPLVVSEDFS